jgi:hypothetical protein
LNEWEVKSREVLQGLLENQHEYQVETVIGSLKTMLFDTFKGLMVEKGKLLQALDQFRDIFLLGRGDLCLVFQDMLSRLKEEGRSQLSIGGIVVFNRDNWSAFF